MVRAPCCEKMGLKRGPWTAEEDQVLINFISLYGHGNWRALPKQAGLQRCGKSCRLRWINYLRPDIKRGNFTREEEDSILNLHRLLGNRWSAIAARLPGRTDNEIKNVWHTHLKKRLHTKEQKMLISDMISHAEHKPQPVTCTSTTSSHGESAITCYNLPPSPQPSSSSTEGISSTFSNDHVLVGSPNVHNDKFLEIGESLTCMAPAEVVFPLSPLSGYEMLAQSADLVHDGDLYEMNFWYEMFNRSGELFVPDMF